MTRITNERLWAIAAGKDWIRGGHDTAYMARELLWARAVVEAARKAVDEYRQPRLPSLAAALTAYDEATHDTHY